MGPRPTGHAGCQCVRASLSVSQSTLGLAAGKGHSGQTVGQRPRRPPGLGPGPDSCAASIRSPSLRIGGHGWRGGRPQAPQCGLAETRLRTRPGRTACPPDCRWRRAHEFETATRGRRPAPEPPGPAGRAVQLELVRAAQARASVKDHGRGSNLKPLPARVPGLLDSAELGARLTLSQHADVTRTRKSTPPPEPACPAAVTAPSPRAGAAAATPTGRPAGGRAAGCGPAMIGHPSPPDVVRRGRPSVRLSRGPHGQRARHGAAVSARCKAADRERGRGRGRGRRRCPSRGSPPHRLRGRHRRRAAAGQGPRARPAGPAGRRVSAGTGGRATPPMARTRSRAGRPRHAAPVAAPPHSSRVRRPSLAPPT